MLGPRTGREHRAILLYKFTVLTAWYLVRLVKDRTPRRADYLDGSGSQGGEDLVGKLIYIVMRASGGLGRVCSSYCRAFSLPFVLFA